MTACSTASANSQFRTQIWSTHSLFSIFIYFSNTLSQETLLSLSHLTFFFLSFFFMFLFQLSTFVGSDHLELGSCVGPPFQKDHVLIHNWGAHVCNLRLFFYCVPKNLSRKIVSVFGPNGKYKIKIKT